MRYKDVVLRETDDFDAKKELNNIEAWVKDYFSKNNIRGAVVGISGGKDSTVVAKILTNALGKNKVFGLIMPNGTQKDFNDALAAARVSGIGYSVVNIENIYNETLKTLGKSTSGKMPTDVMINIAPRIRMTMMYVYAQITGFIVAGTGNLSERTLGYFTKHGDGACDFNIIGNYTSLEVMRLGHELGLPDELVFKTPSDGLTGMSDEERLGVTYVDVHKYLRNRTSELTEDTIEKIEELKKKSAHKLLNTPMIPYTL